MRAARCRLVRLYRESGIRAYAGAGFDEVYIGQVGGEHDGFFEFYGNTVLPRLRQG